MLTKILQDKDFSGMLFVCCSTGISVCCSIVAGSGGSLGWLGSGHRQHSMPMKVLTEIEVHRCVCVLVLATHGVPKFAFCS